MATTIILTPTTQGNEAVWEFRWRSIWSAPAADPTYFPAILSGRIDPGELALRIQSFNAHLLTQTRSLRCRFIIPLIFYPLAILLWILYAQSLATGSRNFSLMFAAIGIFISATVSVVIANIRARRIMEQTTVTLRNLVAATGQQYMSRGLFWSLQVVDRLNVSRRGRLLRYPVFYLKIEVVQPGMVVAASPGGQVVITPGGGVPMPMSPHGYPTTAVAPGGGYMPYGAAPPAPGGYQAGYPQPQPNAAFFTPPAGSGGGGFYPAPGTPSAVPGCYAVPAGGYAAPAGGYAPLATAAPGAEFNKTNTVANGGAATATAPRAGGVAAEDDDPRLY